MRTPQRRLPARIAEIRGLQREAERMRLEAASAALAVQSELQDEELQLQGARERAWRAAVGGGQFDFVLSRSWSQALATGADRLEQLSGAVARAEDHKTERAEAYRMSSARAEGAEQLERKARAHHRRRRDERLVAETADRFARRGRHED